MTTQSARRSAARLPPAAVAAIVQHSDAPTAASLLRAHPQFRSAVPAGHVRELYLARLRRLAELIDGIVAANYARSGYLPSVEHDGAVHWRVHVSTTGSLRLEVTRDGLRSEHTVARDDPGGATRTDRFVHLAQRLKLPLTAPLALRVRSEVFMPIVQYSANHRGHLVLTAYRGPRTLRRDRRTHWDYDYSPPMPFEDAVAALDRAWMARVGQHLPFDVAPDRAVLQRLVPIARELRGVPTADVLSPAVPRTPPKLWLPPRRVFKTTGRSGSLSSDAG